ncbi:tape measure protein [Arthrobacter phage Lewando]|nr:tape measure protein [Arthrobacter phage Lewando]
MSSIDERVVQMKFNNSQFESGVKQTQQSLDSLKKGLNLDASAKSLQGLSNAGSKFSLAGVISGLGKSKQGIQDLNAAANSGSGVAGLNAIASGVQSLSSKFSAMSIVGITALTNIANKAVNAGMTLADSLTVAPIRAGFDEYELKMGSIQTILANTSRHGTKLKDVTHALEELNTYADQTIYNFGDMTRNIGMFTNAGIKLEDATSMIKGFSNEAASSGTNAQQAAGAAYQLSQAMSKGKVTLEDWKSLTNASMGSKNMQLGILDIAKAMGTLETAGVSADTVTKDFNGSLEKGWLTAEVMQKYLQIQAGDLTKEQIKAIGLTDQQVEAFLKQQKNAEEAATKVRTWTQLVGTMQESVGSGWSETWEILIGDFDKATELFTNVSNTLGPMIKKAADARNNLLKGWVKMGGRNQIIDALSNSFSALMAIIKPVSDAFKEIFPPVTASNLMEISTAILNFTKALMPSKTTLDAVKRIAKGLFAVLDMGKMILFGVVGMLDNLLKQAGKSGGGILEFAAKIGDWLVKQRNAMREGMGLVNFFMTLTKILKWPIEKLQQFGDWVGKAFEGFNKEGSKAAAVGAAINNRLAPLKDTGNSISQAWQHVANWFRDVGNFLRPAVDGVVNFFKGIGNRFAEAMQNGGFSGVLDLINTGLFAGLVLMLKNFTSGGGLVDQIKDALGFGGGDEGGGFLDTIKETLGGVTDTLSTMQTTLKAHSLILIAGALALLTASVVALTLVDQTKLAAALGTMTVMFVQLSAAMAVLDKMDIGTGAGKLFAIGGMMVLMAIAINILASAVKKLADLDWQELAKGLVGVTVLLGGMAGAVKLMGTQNGSMIRTGIGLIAIAIAVKMLAESVAYFSGMAWEDMARGLAGVGAVLAALTLFTRLAKFNKGAIGTGVGLILLGVALKVVASAVTDFAYFPVQALQQGLGAITAVLGALAIFTRVADPAGIVRTGIAMVILGGALKIIATVIKDLSGLSWEELSRGMAGMGGSLLVISGAMNTMPKGMLISAASLVIVAASLKILSDVLKQMGGMSWEEIAKGLVTLSASLIIISSAMYLMSGALPGAAALIIVAGALAILAPVLQTLGSMSLLEIGTALAALAATFILLGAAALILGPVVPVLMGLGIAMTLLSVGLLAMGIGVAAAGLGLTMIAAAGAAATPVLVGLITALLNLIPFALTKLGEGIIALAGVIAKGGPAIVNAINTVLKSLMTSIRTMAPLIVKTLVDLIFLLVNTLVNNVPKLVDSGFKLLNGILTGIANNIGKIITSATNIIVNFLNGIANNLPRIIQAGVNLIVKFIDGIRNAIPQLLQAGTNLVLDFVNGLANNIRNNQSRMNDAGRNLAGAIVEGMVNGIGAGIQGVIDAAVNLGKGALEAAKNILGIHSPSREFHKVGAWSAEGAADGIDDNAHLVADAAANMGDTALTTMSKALSGLGSAIDADVDMAPTIRPVLDLSAVKKDAGLIPGMLSTPAMDLSSSYAKASTVALQQRQAVQEVDVVKTGAVPATGTTNTFIQNNYSPKELSAGEIYRNTKSLISTSKGALDNAK